jgi:hypothetical protein
MLSTGSCDFCFTSNLKISEALNFVDFYGGILRFDSSLKGILVDAK